MKNRRNRLGRTLCAMALSGAAVTASAQISEGYIIKYHAPKIPEARTTFRSVSAASATPAPNDVSMSKIHELSGDQELIKITGDDQQAIERQVAQLSQHAGVALIERDSRVVPRATAPNDPRFPEQWSLNSDTAGVNVLPAWDYSKGEGIVVAVIDTGIVKHPDITKSLIPGYDFIYDVSVSGDGDGRDDDPTDAGDGVSQGECGDGQPESDQDSSWHGTSVTGVLAADFNNGIGMTGIAPNIKVLPIRVMGRCGGYSSDVFDAMRWAAGLPVPGQPMNQTPVQVINLSLGIPEPAACSSGYQSAINDVRALGVTVVVASGNNGDDVEKYSPGNCRGVISVGSTDSSATRATYSNYGEKLDLVAPGGGQDARVDGILATSNDGARSAGDSSYVMTSGTSLSAPLVSGAVAMVKSVSPNIKPDAIEYVLKATATSLGSKCPDCGAGLINVGEALLAAKGIKPLNQDLSDLIVQLVGDNGRYQPIDEQQGRVQFQVRVTNVGTATAQGVNLKHAFPMEATLEAFTNDEVVTCDKVKRTCALGDLAPKQSQVVTVATRVKAESRRLKMKFGATVTSDSTELNSENNIAEKLFGGSVSLGLLGLLLIAACRRTLRVRR